uniref:Kinesin motor domain-containing protein n=1 Tax=Heterorhabditis bacteriophora TaxID=37862 RepID=A0A1I7WAQ3_HETBA
MALVNVAQCDVEAGIDKKSDVTVLTKRSDDGQSLNT